MGRRLQSIEKGERLLRGGELNEQLAFWMGCSSV